MTEQHPITPPLELVEQWECEYHHMAYGPDLSIFISEKAARWGADQQLELDAKWLDTNALYTQNLTISPSGDALRKVMRPKPSGLKKHALAIVENLGVCDRISPKDEEILRRALESLPS